jgi:hypothetical protein
MMTLNRHWYDIVNDRDSWANHDLIHVFAHEVHYQLRFQLIILQCVDINDNKVSESNEVDDHVYETYLPNLTKSRRIKLDFYHCKHGVHKTIWTKFNTMFFPNMWYFRYLSIGASAENDSDLTPVSDE